MHCWLVWVALASSLSPGKSSVHMLSAHAYTFLAEQITQKDIMMV